MCKFKLLLVNVYRDIKNAGDFVLRSNVLYDRLQNGLQLFVQYKRSYVSRSEKPSGKTTILFNFAK